MDKEQIYIRLDADDIGNRIELALIESETDKAQTIHNSVQKSMEKLRHYILATGDIILMYGCDDILFCTNASSFNIELLLELNKIFVENTGFTLSFGVGNSISQAMFSLRKAKLSGKNRICKG